MVRKEPKIFAKFLTCAQEYINVDNYLHSRKDHKGDEKRKKEDEVKAEKVEENKKQRTETKLTRNEARPPRADKFRTYTSLDNTLYQISSKLPSKITTLISVLSTTTTLTKFPTTIIPYNYNTLYIYDMAMMDNASYTFDIYFD